MQAWHSAGAVLDVEHSSSTKAEPQQPRGRAPHQPGPRREVAGVLRHCLPETGNCPLLVAALGVLVAGKGARVECPVVGGDGMLKVAQRCGVIAAQAEEVAAGDPGLRGPVVDFAQLLGQQQQVCLRMPGGKHACAEHSTAQGWRAACFCDPWPKPASSAAACCTPAYVLLEVPQRGAEDIAVLERVRSTGAHQGERRSCLRTREPASRQREQASAIAKTQAAGRQSSASTGSPASPNAQPHGVLLRLHRMRKLLENGLAAGIQRARRLRSAQWCWHPRAPRNKHPPIRRHAHLVVVARLEMGQARLPVRPCACPERRSLQLRQRELHSVPAVLRLPPQHRPQCREHAQRLRESEQLRAAGRSHAPAGLLTTATAAADVAPTPEFESPTQGAISEVEARLAALAAKLDL